MDYIGSKKQLIGFVLGTIDKKVKIKDSVFCDLFAGTGIVSKSAKNYKPKKIISNDFQLFSSNMTKALLISKTEVKFNFFKELIGSNEIKDIEVYVNNLKPIIGFATKNFSPESINHCEYERMFFTIENAMKIDAIRNFLTKNKDSFTDYEYILLKSSLIESLDKVSNVASVYGAYLKKFKQSAIRDLDFKMIPLDDIKIDFEVYNDYAEEVIKKIRGDILYLDPPYNNRQYASNYHVLEMISNEKDVEVIGKTALPDNRKMSDFSYKTKVLASFDSLIKESEFNNVFISYNTDGIMTQEEVFDILKKYYKDISIEKKVYSRFKADTSKNRTYDESVLEEFLLCGLGRL